MMVYIIIWCLQVKVQYKLVFSFIAEAFLYYRVSQKIPNLIKGLINIDEEVK